MHPLLFEIYGFQVHFYGLFVALGFFAAIYLAAYLSEKDNFSKDLIFDISFYLLISAVIGARLMYVIVEYKFYLKNPLNILKIWEGGLVYYGGFIAAVGAGLLYKLKHKDLNILKLGDILLTVLPLGQAIGRIGCLFAGCCYGKPCSLPWAVKFTSPMSLAPINVYLHPTQIYHMIANFLIFLILLYVLKKGRTFYGQVVCLYGILYSIGRFVVECFRGDPRGMLGFISTSQAVSIVVFTISIIAFIYIKKRKGK